mmetsp:Transcript_4087/g.12028  ORF Transcript_4087/g.12028 Transcript_4087/m.12028 type:complete len:359 (-) Transcript_4087:38-1114(-)
MGVGLKDNFQVLGHRGVLEDRCHGASLLRLRGPNGDEPRAGIHGKEHQGTGEVRRVRAPLGLAVQVQLHERRRVLDGCVVDALPPKPIVEPQDVRRRVETVSPNRQLRGRLVDFLLRGGLDRHAMGSKVRLHLSHGHASKVRVYAQVATARVDAPELERAWVLAPLGPRGPSDDHGGRRLDAHNVVPVLLERWVEHKPKALVPEVAPVDHELGAHSHVQERVFRLLHDRGRNDRRHRSHVFPDLIHPVDRQVRQVQRHAVGAGGIRPFLPRVECQRNDCVGDNRNVVGRWLEGRSELETNSRLQHTAKDRVRGLDPELRRDGRVQHHGALHDGHGPCRKATGREQDQQAAQHRTRPVH